MERGLCAELKRKEVAWSAFALFKWGSNRSWKLHHGWPPLRYHWMDDIATPWYDRGVGHKEHLWVATAACRRPHSDLVLGGMPNLNISDPDHGRCKWQRACKLCEHLRRGILISGPGKAGRRRRVQVCMLMPVILDSRWLRHIFRQR